MQKTGLKSIATNTKEHYMKLFKRSRNISLMDFNPSDADLFNACTSMSHNFGLKSDINKKAMVLEAREWLIAWGKTLPQFERKVEQNIIPDSPVEQTENISITRLIKSILIVLVMFGCIGGISPLSLFLFCRFPVSTVIFFIILLGIGFGYIVSDIYRSLK
jgi:hypothetical protein